MTGAASDPAYAQTPRLAVRCARAAVGATVLGALLMAFPTAHADDLGVESQPLDIWIDGHGSRAGARDLWGAVDPGLQRRLEATLAALGLQQAIQQKRLGVALVDISDLQRPRVAAVNGDEMMYAASLPKIAIMLGAFEKIQEGKMTLDAQTEAQMLRMIRESSNTAASALMDRVGKSYIARVLRSPRYQLYDERRNGGLWVGKNYAQTGLWQRDPLHNLSHGATPMQVARFYYLLETGQLVSPAHSRRMKWILADSRIKHKFVQGILDQYPYARVYRKSGTWRHWHSDSAIIEHDGKRYIAVGLCESEQGGAWLSRMIVELDHLVERQTVDAGAAVKTAASEGFSRRSGFAGRGLRR
jgi:beta-lactamase class A